MTSLSNQSPDDLHVLVAEDDADDCELFREVSRDSNRNIQCHFVHNGEELLRHLNHLVTQQARRLPDLIVLDVNMPRMNGKEALRRLKQDERLKDIPVVTLTTSNDRKLKEEMEQLGACAFYTKPHNIDLLKDVIEDMLTVCLQPGFGK